MKTIFTSLALFLGMFLPMTAAATNSLRIEPFEIMRDTEMVVPVVYESDTDFTGFQTSITLPEGLSFVDHGVGYATLSGEAGTSHQITSNCESNILKLVCFSSENAILPTSDHLLTITLQADETFDGGDLSITNTIFSDTSNQDILFENTTTWVTCTEKDPFTYAYNDEDMTATVTGLAEWVTELIDPVIPDTKLHDGRLYIVNAIGESAFSTQGMILKGTLTIASSIISIGEWAFFECASLTGPLALPSSITRIEAQTFAGCSGFSGTLTLPDAITYIGVGAFQNCTGLTGSLFIPDSVKLIEDFAFHRCSGFDGTLTLPKSLESIGSLAFAYCSGFTGSLLIPENVTVIEDRAFKGCTGFSDSLTISDSVMSIGQYAFEECTGFKGTLSLSTSLKVIDFGTFKGCSGFSGPLIIPDSVESIEQSAFYGCGGFNELTIGESVKKIGNAAFCNCAGFKGDLIIPDSVEEIGESAFALCKGFDGRLSFGKNIKIIAQNAFASCSSLNGNLIIPNSVTEIGNDAFSSCSGFNGTLTLGKNISLIGEGAFSSCSGLTGPIDIPGSITEISNSAFSGCSGVTGPLTLPESITTIGQGAFFGCSSLIGDILLPNSLLEIGDMAFEGCQEISSFNILNTISPIIGNNAFPLYTTIRVATGAGGAYRSAEGWKTYEYLYEFGDANIDKKLSVSDAVAVANDIVGAPNTSWDRPCADINFDDAITISDVTSIVSAVMEYAPSTPEETSPMRAAGYSTDKLVAADFNLDERGEAVVPVMFDTNNELVALQVDFNGGDALRIENVEVNAAVGGTHSVKTNRLDDGSLRVVLFSLAGNKIESTDEPLFYVRLHGNNGRFSEGNLTARRALASTRSAEDVALSYSGGSNSVITGVDGLSSDGTMVYGEEGELVIANADGKDVTVYDASGRIVDMFKATGHRATRTLPGGLYIVCIDNLKFKILI